MRPRSITYGEDDLRPYTYQHLENPTQSLRFFRLKGANEGNPEIDCELVTRDLFDDDGDIAIRDVQYSALSWSWGPNTEDTTKTIYIHEGDEIFTMSVRKNLYDSLMALRRRHMNKTLWIDAVCINQRSIEERNHQVQLMSLIYGLATSVYIWLGEADDDSRVAIPFMRNEVLRFSQFDDCYRPEAAPKWRALLNFLRRPWFSRSWIIQEIALANDAEIICGRDNDDRIHWDDFADAVQLFVDTETGSHRISEIIQKDPDYHNVPRMFESIASLPAAVLVEATRNLFQQHKEDRDRGTQRVPVMKLEQLASHFSIFEVTVPHDSIYALLAIARDAVPVAEMPATRSLVSEKFQSPLISWAVSHLKTSAKPFLVDYGQGYVEACRRFVEFCIYNADPFRALDILCRPWSQPQEKVNQFTLADDDTFSIAGTRRPEFLPSWVSQVTGSSHVVHAYVHTRSSMEPIVSRRNGDTLVGTPDLTARNYNAAGRERVNFRCLRFRKGVDHHSMFALGFELDEVVEVQVASQGGNIPIEWAYTCGWTSPHQAVPEEFWRTLVADRGRLSVTPPKYFSRACQEAFAAAFATGYLRPADYISHGHSSVLAEFCRRVEVVVWNRALVKTRSGRLGLVQKVVRSGDVVCILYGCSVPVVLHKVAKGEDEYRREYELKRTAKMKKWAYHWGRFREAVERQKQKRLEKEVREANGLSPITLNAVQLPPQFQLATPDKAGRPRIPQKPERLASPKGSFSPESTGNGPAPNRDPEAHGVANEDRKPVKIDLDEYDADPFSRLTPTKNYYIFKGECYIHGMMDGQAIQHKNAEKIANSLFELR
ncbi:HET-domain-containing protein [Thozetella sp. PMI_491]|nr:HET-domain-containing protein [Thozetella sp. PMI_491]